jgi:hypothetical protein
MKVLLAILFCIHGLIHLFGFLKAFSIIQFNAIAQPITKPVGLLWLMVFLLFFGVLFSYVLNFKQWWLLCWIAIGLSQVLIVIYWSDAKPGTLMNIIFLIASFIAFSKYQFNNNFYKERRAILENTFIANPSTIRLDEIDKLPSIIQKWLKASGVVGKPQIHNVYLKQNLKMRLKPEQREWRRAAAEQIFTLQPPAFIWNIESSPDAIFSFVGRDKFEQGKGEMLIKLLAAIPVADVSGSKRIDEATAQRYLAELVWFPYAALSPCIKWEQLDDLSVKAYFKYNGTQASGVFYFNQDGYFDKFIAMRYKDKDDQNKYKWEVKSLKTEKLNGIFMPTKCEVIWHLENDQWRWLELEVDRIQYNLNYNKS